TLPAKTRRDLVKAYTGQSLPETDPDYPALTIANAQQQETISLDKPKPYTVELDWSVSREPEAIVTFLKDALLDGGCAAIICNTVRRAQDIYRALQAADLDISQDDLILFHARFPPIWRQGIEKKVLEKFGKPDDNGRSPHRPRRAIVVATQVIEQSLDLDFDLMISDLAPVDLILQRAGRLHRHKRTAQERHNHPHRLMITKPLPDEKGLPEFESDKYVYEPYVLLRSYLALQKRQQIIIPNDTTTLIEAVYGSEANLPDLEERWLQSLDEMRRAMENNRQKAESKAGGQLVLAPSNMRLMKQAILQLEEDDPEVHQTFRAQTRDIDPGVSLICLHQNGDRTTKDTDVAVHDGQKLIPFNLETIPFSLTKTLLKNMLNIHHRGVIKALVDQPLPKNWKDHAALSYARPLLFINGICDLPDSKYYLKLTQTFGLEIIKKETV
ncbi:CRISPR-associated helicase Cas3, partial [hydrothermal vent metagenome]